LEGWYLTSGYVANNCLETPCLQTCDDKCESLGLVADPLKLHSVHSPSSMETFVAEARGSGCTSFEPVAESPYQNVITQKCYYWDGSGATTTNVFDGESKFLCYCKNGIIEDEVWNSILQCGIIDSGSNAHSGVSDYDTQGNFWVSGSSICAGQGCDNTIMKFDNIVPTAHTQTTIFMRYRVVQLTRSSEIWLFVSNANGQEVFQFYRSGATANTGLFYLWQNATVSSAVNVIDGEWISILVYDNGVDSVKMDWRYDDGTGGSQTLQGTFFRGPGPWTIEIGGGRYTGDQRDLYSSYMQVSHFWISDQQAAMPTPEDLVCKTPSPNTFEGQISKPVLIPRALAASEITAAVQKMAYYSGVHPVGPNDRWFTFDTDLESHHNPDATAVAPATLEPSGSIPQYTSSPRARLYALQLASGQQLQVPVATTFDWSYAWTLTLWVRAHVGATGVLLFADTGTQTDLVLAQMVSPSTWTHLALVHDSTGTQGSAKLHVDGEWLDAVLDVSNLTIGGYLDFSNTDVDDLRVFYDLSMSKDDIRAISEYPCLSGYDLQNNTCTDLSITGVK